MNLAWLAFALCTSHGLSHTITILSTMRRLAGPAAPPVSDPPGVTLIRPARGLDHDFERTMRSSFQLDYPRLQIIFCIEDDNDPAIPVLQGMIADYPSADATLLVGKDSFSPNPKLNNIAKGWNAATSDWIIVSDSNTLLPTDYVEALFAAWDSRTAVVSHVAMGIEPVGFAADLECAFLNTLQTRWILAAESAGLGFALGKSLMFRRDIVDRAGGLAALSREAAEDIAATKMARRMGLKAHLARRPIPQPLGRRGFADVWRRQIRWARLRRAGLPVGYRLELFLGGLMPISYATILAATGSAPVAFAIGYAAIWYGLEAALAKSAGWPLSIKSPLAWIVRDLMIPVVWVAGFSGNRFDWRGNAMTVSGIKQPVDRRNEGPEEVSADS